MSTPPRIYLLLPTWLFFAIDVILTLSGQPESYWASERETAVEANPLARILLVRSPELFAGLAIIWALAFGLFVLRGRQPYAGWVAVVVGFAHAIGGTTWLSRWGAWGWVIAVSYLILASQLARFCWKRAGFIGN